MIFLMIYCISDFGNTTQELWSLSSIFGNTTQEFWSLSSDFGNTTRELWSPSSIFGNTTQELWNPSSIFGNATQRLWSPISDFGNTTLVKNCYMLIVFGKYFYLVCQRFSTLLFTHDLPAWGNYWRKLVNNVRQERGG